MSFLIISLLLFIIGSLVAFVLLIPLIFIYKKCTKFLSLSLFVSVGTLVALCIGLTAMYTFAHGHMPPIERDTFRGLALYLTIGSASAFSAWSSLRKSDE
ncbi:MAG: hypothetical protein AAF699_04645, partial [Pseudomonadota bacterium]